MVDRVEEPDDAAFDLECVRNIDLTLEQIVNGLRDDRLAVAGGPIDEHGMSAIDGRPELVEDAIADHQVRKRVADALAAHLVTGRTS